MMIVGDSHARGRIFAAYYVSEYTNSEHVHIGICINTNAWGIALKILKMHRYLREKITHATHQQLYFFDRKEELWIR